MANFTTRGAPGTLRSESPPERWWISSSVQQAAVPRGCFEHLITENLQNINSRSSTLKNPVRKDSGDQWLGNNGHELMMVEMSFDSPLESQPTFLPGQSSSFNVDIG